MVYIRNSFCCGHGQSVYRFANYCKKHGIEYILEKGVGGSKAEYNGKIVRITALTTIKEIISGLSLQCGEAEGVPLSD